MAVIFLIEDDLQTTRMVTRLLSKRGHNVETFVTGNEGLQKLFNTVPDLILIDLGLPDMDGQTVIAVIRQQPLLRLLPIIAFTAWPPGVVHKMARSYGCDGVITKPIDTQRFVQEVEGFLCKVPSDGRG